MKHLKRVKMQAMWLLHLHKHSKGLRAVDINPLLKTIHELVNTYVKDGYIFDYEIRKRSREEVHRLGRMEG